MPSALVDHGVYALAWAGFGALHSMLAGNTLRGHLGAYARLTYNGIAVLSLAAVWALGWALIGPGNDFAVPAWLAMALDVVYVGGWAGLLWALSGYDLGLLAGTRQIRDARAGVTPETLADEEPLRVDGLHRWVRHPLYAGAFLILWGRIEDPLSAATAAWASAYLVIGARIEEKRLCTRFGEAYRDYRAKVPAFVPWKGRAV